MRLEDLEAMSSDLPLSRLFSKSVNVSRFVSGGPPANLAVGGPCRGTPVFYVVSSGNTRTGPINTVKVPCVGNQVDEGTGDPAISITVSLDNVSLVSRADMTSRSSSRLVENVMSRLV